MRTLVRIYAAGMMLFAVTTLLAQPPEILHAQWKIQTVDHGLSAVLDGLKAQKGATWVGYSIAVKERISSGTRSNHVEYLEEDNSHTLTDSSEENIKSYDHALILVKVADGAGTKLHVVNPDRALDADGLPLVWLNGVDAEDSVRVLADLARRNDAEHLRDSAIFAISIHQNPAATAALISLTGEENDLKIRRRWRSGSQASAIMKAFWLFNTWPAQTEMRGFARS
ncbi:hypothetical protein [Tunturiibacter gelidiferens]|uniref:hypothetical protein n=1 Tax=Tunturiibacter gelidiferens TaxID=3069689 RepID=UPI003D9AD4A8